jgi:hypothetical protein
LLPITIPNHCLKEVFIIGEAENPTWVITANFYDFSCVVGVIVTVSTINYFHHTSLIFQTTSDWKTSCWFWGHAIDSILALKLLKIALLILFSYKNFNSNNWFQTLMSDWCSSSATHFYITDSKFYQSNSYSKWWTPNSHCQLAPA